MAEPVLSVRDLFAEREVRSRRDRDAVAQLERHRIEALDTFRERLDNFQLNETIIQSGLDRIKRAFERGEHELMITTFPSDFCTDGGRAILNAGSPPINKPTVQLDEPVWLATMPAGVRQVYTFWHDHLRPGGFKFSARIINFPDGKPGDVGLFFTWPKNTMDL